jgi:ABC-type transport system involved in cytochrome c biogenesis ATPase subunit
MDLQSFSGRELKRVLACVARARLAPVLRKQVRGVRGTTRRAALAKLVDIGRELEFLDEWKAEELVKSNFDARSSNS